MGILRAMIGSRRERRARGRDRKRSRVAPLVEGLEGRALLSTLTVMNNGDSGPGSLRATAAAAAAGDVILFSPSLDGQTITLSSGEINLTLVVAQWPASMLLATEEFDVLFSNHPGHEAALRRRQLQQRSDTYERVVLYTHVGGRAAQPIAARRVDQPGAHGVELYAARGGQQVRLIEHERSEPPLPQMASPPLAEVDHPGVTPMGLTDRPAQPVGRVRNSDQMNVVGHQRIRPNLNVMGAARLTHQFQVELVILVTKESRLATVAPLGDVVRQTRYNHSCQSGHEASVSNPQASVNN